MISSFKFMISIAKLLNFLKLFKDNSQFYCTFHIRGTLLNDKNGYPMYSLLPNLTPAQYFDHMHVFPLAWVLYSAPESPPYLSTIN